MVSDFTSPLPSLGRILPAPAPAGRRGGHRPCPPERRLRPAPAVRHPHLAPCRPPCPAPRSPCPAPRPAPCPPCSPCPAPRPSCPAPCPSCPAPRPPGSAGCQHQRPPRSSPPHSDAAPEKPPQLRGWHWQGGFESGRLLPRSHKFQVCPPAARGWLGVKNEDVFL